MGRNDKQVFPINRRIWYTDKTGRKKLFRNTKYPRSVTETEANIPLKTYNSSVKLFQSRCLIRKTNRTTAKISKYHILERGNTGRDICDKILKTDIGLSGRYRNINSNGVVTALSPILELLKNRHNKFDYFNKLKCTIAKKAKKYRTQKFKHQIDVRLVKYFFSLLVHKNVPLELFGTSKNQKAIKQTIGCLLKTVPDKMLITDGFKRKVRGGCAIGASLDIKPLINKLDISKINWLHSIDNITEQWIIMLQLLHWFFAQYIVKVLHKYVVLKVFRKKWVYITKDNWCNMQEEFIKQKETTASLVPFSKLNKKCTVGTYKFLPSSSGMRAIFLAKHNVKKQYDDMDIVLRFLQQLYVTYLNENGIPTVQGCKTAVSNFLKSRPKSHLYFVTCDIANAFDSIIQKKLYDIICIYCEKLGKFLSVRLCSKSRSKTKYTVQVISNSLKRSKNVIPTKAKPKLIKTKWFTNKLHKLIFQQKVKLNGRLYSIKRGVPQGTSVSPILSEIYYRHMSNEMFAEYTANGLLATYADDFLYITENKHYAVRFLETIKKGIPEYNIKFNSSKIHTNVETPNAFRYVRFLGLRFDIPILNTEKILKQ